MLKHTIEENLRIWDKDHPWTEDGDEWKGQAVRCGCSYPEWKNSVVTHFLKAELNENAVILEIGPGHGRWTAEFLPYCGRAILVELSPNCIEACRRRFAQSNKIDYRIGDGQSLSGVADGTVDLVWSFDVFVHMRPTEFLRYLHEIRRVLKPGGRAILHHAGRRHWALIFSFLSGRGPLSRKIYQYLSMGSLSDNDGWRSNVSAWLVRRMARAADLQIVRQSQRWGAGGRYGVPRYGDRVTVLKRPA